MLTVDEAVQRARRYLARGPVINNESVSAESDVLLKNGEYRVTFKSGQVVHVDAGSGTIMEPGNGYLVTRRD